MPTVELLTLEDAITRRGALLAELGCSYDDLRERADAYVLEAHELAVLTEIERLDYLIASAR